MSPWTDQALCAQADPEAHFVGKGASPKPAKDTCARCEVTAQCLKYALGRDDFGVWAGMTRMERRKFKGVAA